MTIVIVLFVAVSAKKSFFDPLTIDSGLPISTFTGLHKCEQGFHCVYKSGGAVLDRVEGPGWHYHEPLLTSAHQVKTKQQTDTIPNVPCGSSKGGTATINIEVINQLVSTPECILKVIKTYGFDYDRELIYNYVPSEVLQFCKNYDLDAIYTTRLDELDEILVDKLRSNIKNNGLEECIKIRGVRMGRANLDPEMTQKFEAVEKLKKDQEHAKEKAKTARIVSATELEKVEAEAKQEQLKKQYERENLLQEAKNNADIQSINDHREAKKIESKAKADSVAIREIAKANKDLHTAEYLELERFKAFYNNAKLHTITPEALKNTLSHRHTSVEGIPFSPKHPIPQETQVEKEYRI